MSRAKILVPLAILVAAMAVGSTALAGGGGCHEGVTTDDRVTSVDVGKNCFFPTVVRVPVNEVVAWKNYDPVVHTITFAGGLMDQEIEPGETATFRFASAGVYPYYCLIHPRMAGAVVVGTANGEVAAAAPQPVAALTEKPEEGMSPLAAALLVGFIATPLSFAAGRILRGRRKPA